MCKLRNTIMNKQILTDKILGCFNGKNVGGTLGAPIEGKNGFFNVEYFLQQNIINNPAPNDDLDLQISSLNAVRRYGGRVNAEILSEYFNIFVNPSWAEYGVGKSNLRRGLCAPMSGYHGNSYKDSCGSFIRSEIWACLCPGHPELATRYAYFDACVDHADEGLYGEIFWAAVQSCAFVENNIRKLIVIGLSYIPKDCTLANGIKLMIDCYDSGKTYEQARDILFTQVAGSFSYQHTKLKDIKNTQYTPAPAGFDAPNNICIAILGLLYGEGDFGKSMLLAVNCGEDSDCSAGTLAATLGIIYGNSALPEKWIKPIGNVIKVSTLNYHDFWMSPVDFFLPHTTQEMAEEIICCIPKMLTAGTFALTDDGIKITPKENLYCQDQIPLYLEGAFGNREWEYFNTTQLVNCPHYSVVKEFSLFKMIAIYDDGIFFKQGEEKTITLKIYDNGESKIQHWLTLRTYLPNGIETKESVCTMPLNNFNGYVIEKQIKLKINDFQQEKFDLILDFEMEGQASVNLFKLRFFAK